MVWLGFIFPRHCLHWSHHSRNTLEHAQCGSSLVFCQKQRPLAQMVNEPQVVWAVSSQLAGTPSVSSSWKMGHGNNHGRQFDNTLVYNWEYRFDIKCSCTDACRWNMGLALPRKCRRIQSAQTTRQKNRLVEIINQPMVF